jgi:hypothetical protein
MAVMAKKSGSKTAPTKSDVIRSMPTASATDIIKKAKSFGLSLTANHVYAVRAIDKRRGKPGQPQLAVETPRRGSSKTAFIRGFAHDMPAAKVVEAAKRAGVKISKQYVYRVRTLTKPASLVSARDMSRGRSNASASYGRSEQRLTSLALEIGLLRASALLERVRMRLGT